MVFLKSRAEYFARGLLEFMLLYVVGRRDKKPGPCLTGPVAAGGARSP